MRLSLLHFNPFEKDSGEPSPRPTQDRIAATSGFAQRTIVYVSVSKNERFLRHPWSLLQWRLPGPEEGKAEDCPTSIKIPSPSSLRLTLVTIIVRLNVTHIVVVLKMIVSYRDKRTADFAAGNRVKAFSGIEQASLLKIDRLRAAVALQDLAALPGNRFEALRGDRKGQYSIRINDQWRICFEWSKGSPGPENVEIVDYH